MAITTEVIAEALDLIGQDRTTFSNPDPMLAEIIEVESLRLIEAAKILGLEWNGTFNRGHIMLIARTYHNLAQVAKFKKVPA